MTTDSRYKNICADIGGNNADDLYQEFVLTLLEMKEVTLSNIINIDFYFVRSVINLSRSKAFKQKYLPTHEEIKDNAVKDEHNPTEKHDREKLIQIIASELDLMEHEYGKKYPYHVNLFRAYVNENCNVRQLDRKANIDYSTAWRQIQNVKKRLLNRIKKEQNNGTL